MISSPRSDHVHRIGIDARLLAYREGGIAEYIRHLIDALADCVSENADPESAYLILQSRKAQNNPFGASVTDQPTRFSRIRTLTPCHHRLERIALGVEVARLRLDVLHSPDFIPPRMVPRLDTRRSVITVHDLNFLHYPQFQTPDSRRYYNGQIRAAVHQADHILADSEATKTDLAVMLDVPPEKVTVHLLGVDPAFQPLAAEDIAMARERLGLPESYLLFVGTFEPRKNLVGLLNAYALLRHRLPDLPPLIIAGRRGWLYESIFQRVAALGLQARVIWLENVATADLPALYNGASALVLPSFYEGFGLPPLEAMACGVPTVVADRASLPEVVGDTGVLIDPERPESLADGLHRILTDSALRERSRRDGLARAATFTWTRTAEIALSVYRHVLDQA